jgi:hypothetical protein
MQAILAFRGLEFARFSHDGFFFGRNDQRTKLHARNHVELDRLLFPLDM